MAPLWCPATFVGINRVVMAPIVLSHDCEWPRDCEVATTLNLEQESN
jgi:hypothetical protein